MQPLETPESPPYLAITVARATELSGLSRSMLYERMRDGDIERLKVGAKTLIWYPSLVRFLERQRAPEHEVHVQVGKN